MMESNAGTILVHTVPPEICHVVFPAGFGVGSQQSLIFVRCNNYIGESCDDLLGATARNSAKTPLLKLQKFTNLEDFYRVYKLRTKCLANLVITLTSGIGEVISICPTYIYLKKLC